jgi:predicted RNase H-like HicB family nuclease/predicted RNA binding protein YcfA (HicA-like mRNA interferase family)
MIAESNGVRGNGEPYDSRVKVREVLRLMADDGWYHVRTRGSYRQFEHPTKSGKVTVAGQESMDIHPDTLKEHSATGRSQESEMIEYTVILEQGENNWSAYVPDLPGCVAAAATREETAELIREAIEFHLEGMREDGDPIPPPRSEATRVAIAG